jgi:hypothetical protein
MILSKRSFTVSVLGPGFEPGSPEWECSGCDMRWNFHSHEKYGRTIRRDARFSGRRAGARIPCVQVREIVCVLGERAFDV